MSLRPIDLVRHAWPDFLSAAAFVVIGVFFRDQLEDRGTKLLFMPVVLELFIVFALAVMAMFITVRRHPVKLAVIAVVAACYLFAAWLLAQQAESFANAPIAAAWLLASRFAASGEPFLSPPHVDFVLRLGQISAMLWGAAFVAYVLLMLAFPTNERVVDGVHYADTPAWIWLVVWPLYFVADGIARATIIRGRDRR